jgi:deazaflavin-dependent oxidoreductase (nitroreductase family)
LRRGTLRYVDPTARKSLVQRLLVQLASSRALGRISKTALWRATMWKLERLVLRLSRGRLDAAPGLPTALLETRGARTGLVRRTGVIYFHDGADVIIDASQAGYPSNPSWYYNLRANPDVRLGGQRFHACEVSDETERARLWALADQVFPAFADYRLQAAENGRTVPILRLVAT